MDKNSVRTGFFAGLLGSLCCVTPLVLVLLSLFGLSGAVALAGVWQDTFSFGVFVPLGLLFLALSIFLHIKRKEGKCGVSQLKHYKKYVISVVISSLIFWIVLLYIIVPLGFRLVKW